MDKRNTILESALECFFTHGFTASNISMVSRYSGVSRVTIHKQFTDKIGLLRGAVDRYLTEHNQPLNDFIEADGDVWDAALQFFTEKNADLFEQIKSSVIKADLAHACNLHCVDITHQHRLDIRLAIAKKIYDAEIQGNLTLDRVNLTGEAIAMQLEYFLDGIVLSSEENDYPLVIKQLIDVYRVSTALLPEKAATA